MQRNYMQQMAVLMVLIVAVFSQTVSAKEWYEGGTLHQASALDWQQATYANKLATAGDLVAGTYKNKKFIPEIQNAITSMAGMKKISEELVSQLDAAFAPDPDPTVNQKLYSNQKVSSSAAMVMMLSGWLDL